MDLITTVAVALVFVALLVGNGDAQVGQMPGRRSRQRDPLTPHQRQPVPLPRGPHAQPSSPFGNPITGVRPPTRGQGPAPNQPRPLPRHLPPRPFPRPSFPRPAPHHHPAPGIHHPPPNPNPPPATPNVGAGGAPPGTVYCAPNEYYTPGIEMCCQREVAPLPYAIPPQYAQCCDGDVIDNRTEACCLGQERVYLAEEGCCGAEVYEVRTQACCGARIYQADGRRMCCGGQLVNAANMMCCRGRPTPTQGDPSQYTCCGTVAINVNTHKCCGARPVKQDSTTLGCCGNRMAYRKELESCCATRSGRWMVRPGLACGNPTQAPPAGAPGAGANGVPVVIGGKRQLMKVMPDGSVAIVPMPSSPNRAVAIGAPDANGRQLVLIPVQPGAGAGRGGHLVQPGTGFAGGGAHLVQPGMGYGHGGVRIVQPGTRVSQGGVQLVQPGTGVFQSKPGAGGFSPGVRLVQPGYDVRPPQPSFPQLLPVPRADQIKNPTQDYPTKFRDSTGHATNPSEFVPPKYPTALPATTPGTGKLLYLTKPVANGLSKPVAQPAAEPVAETVTSEPVTSEPVTKLAAEPVTNTTTKP